MSQRKQFLSQGIQEENKAGLSKRYEEQENDEKWPAPGAFFPAFFLILLL